MFHYEAAHSANYLANQAYCQKAERLLQQLGAEYNGFCNSFGYNIESIFHRNNHTWYLRFVKYQGAQNGVTIPAQSDAGSRIEIRIKGLNKQMKPGKYEVPTSLCFSKFEIRNSSLDCQLNGQPDPARMIPELDRVVYLLETETEPA